MLKLKYVYIRFYKEFCSLAPTAEPRTSLCECLQHRASFTLPANLSRSDLLCEDPKGFVHVYRVCTVLKWSESKG